ncbi:unnamed protein product [Cuscuta epithymum]|uniref:CCHC-type domain-containing protein n=1 Tax=Cuscuta epithymum TaxID=186058 RepID=A0AAV0DGF6_9ASTE|nr:unnamed protein product [Cuscuta epithymum]CAH9096632.1 unnamed protein product [Cuscuta epithymum]CAH9109041.1 unnamed protein product [Cuscuta epithymum]CAH9127268.1 unnamed protein product [Cuscuta epithymum]CAH9134904.1 unnamed protein product [Cuscuta epithymum]
MEDEHMTTRNDPRRQVSVASFGASRAMSRALRGRERGLGGREGCPDGIVIDGHVNVVGSTNAGRNNETHIQELGREQAPCDGGDYYFNDVRNDFRFDQTVEVQERYKKGWRRKERRRQAGYDRATYQYNMTVNQVHSWRSNQGEEGSFKALALPVKKKKKSKWNTSWLYSSRQPKCPDYSKRHLRKCNEPSTCFKCGSTGHMKPSCPWRGKGRASGAGKGVVVERSCAEAITGSVTSANQGKAQTGVYAMTEADARANPDSIAG